MKTAQLVRVDHVSRQKVTGYFIDSNMERLKIGNRWLSTSSWKIRISKEKLTSTILTILTILVSLLEEKSIVIRT